MNITYLIYEAERPKTVAERRAADIQTGKIAESVARLGSSVKQAVLRSATRDGGASIAELERLYSAPCASDARDSYEADGERTVRS